MVYQSLPKSCHGPSLGLPDIAIALPRSCQVLLPNLYSYCHSERAFCELWVVYLSAFRYCQFCLGLASFALVLPVLPWSCQVLLQHLYIYCHSDRDSSNLMPFAKMSGLPNFRQLQLLVYFSLSSLTTWFLTLTSYCFSFWKSNSTKPFRTTCTTKIYKPARILPPSTNWSRKSFVLGFAWWLQS